MIHKLIIRNFAIIDFLEIEFSKKLTIVTGETGAGKSILLGALGLIMGNRADNVSLYNPEMKCTVEGHFYVADYDLKEFFDANELDYDDELVVRREITPQGKSRAFINDTPVNLKVLSQLSGSIIDLHLQFDTLDIHEISFQLRMLDALANNKGALKQYQSLFKQYQQNIKQLNELELKNSKAAKEVEFIQFQLKEFNKAELKENEQTALEQELLVLNNAEVIKKSATQVAHILTESDGAIVDQLKEVNRNISSVQKFDKKMGVLSERVENIIEELRDISSEIESIADKTEFDAEKANEIQERLNLIYKLLKKHQVLDVNDLLNLQSDLENQLKQYKALDTEIAEMSSKIVYQEKELRNLAADLSENRKKVVAGFENKIHERLSLLAMEHAKLKVSIETGNNLTATGIDQVEFLFAPNKGSKYLPIKEVASGGELSRLTLVTKSLVASAIPLPTLIFDEIDTGISGDVALRMGNVLQDLSAHHQVVSITHSPQIASKANSHYFVYKKELEDRTVTNVKLLDKQERIIAIAEMLSSKPPTPSAIKNAKELLSSVGV